MVDPKRAKRLASEMREEAEHQRFLADNSNDAEARRYFITKAEAIERRADSLTATDPF